ncbi:hypothetical protein A2U01_0045234, partial [Trifolium medium]|nr:hypothetical protein [Trifolium medium]
TMKFRKLRDFPSSPPPPATSPNPGPARVPPKSHSPVPARRFHAPSLHRGRTWRP